MQRKIFVSYNFVSLSGSYGVGNIFFIITLPITSELVRRWESQIRETTGFTTVAIITWHVLEE